MKADNEKKKEIREKALELFRSKGYQSVTVNEIARASDISKNTFYYYFSSKEDLILDLFRPELEIRVETMVEVMQEKDPYEQLRFLYGKAAEHFEDLGKEIVREALGVDIARDSIREKKPHEKNATFKLIESIYDRAVSEKKIRTDIKGGDLARTLGIQLMGAVQIWATAPHDFELKQCVLEQFDFIARQRVS